MDEIVWLSWKISVVSRKKFEPTGTKKASVFPFFEEKENADMYQNIFWSYFVKGCGYMQC